MTIMAPKRDKADGQKSIASYFLNSGRGPRARSSVHSTATRSDIGEASGALHTGGRSCVTVAVGDKRGNELENELENDEDGVKLAHKRPRTDVVEIDDDVDKLHVSSENVTRQEEAAGVTTKYTPRLDFPRDPLRRAKAQRKLAVDTSRLRFGTDASLQRKKGSKYTPLEQQVIKLQNEHPDKVMLFEVGYKFRFFGRDAEVASRVLNIGCFPDHNFLTAYVPVHRLHIYTRRLVRQGHKVAVVRQMETAAVKAASESRNTVFERKVTAIYTPATLDAGHLEDVGVSDGAGGGACGSGHVATLPPSSYLFSLSEQGGTVTAHGGAEVAQPVAASVAFVALDATLSTIFWGEAADLSRTSDGALEGALMYFRPREILTTRPPSSELSRLVRSYEGREEGVRVECVDMQPAARAALLEELRRFGDGCLAHLALDALNDGVLSALLAALKYFQTLGLHLFAGGAASLQPVTAPGHMRLSGNALQQLAVLEGPEGARAASLLQLIDTSLTAAGARTLRAWLSQPLLDAGAIRERQDAVAALARDTAFAERLRQVLRGVPDLDRVLGRVSLGTAAPPEVVGALEAVLAMPRGLGVVGTRADTRAGEGGLASDLIADHVTACTSEPVLECVSAQLRVLDADAAQDADMSKLFASQDRFPAVHARLRALDEARTVLHALLPSLARELGVPQLSYVNINNQGNHLVEVPVGQKVPADWVKVCGTKKVNRFRPPRVAAATRDVEIAEELLTAECKAAWREYLKSLTTAVPPLRAAARALAALDALLSLATAVAARPGWVRPAFVDESEAPQLRIEGGRAPLLDERLPTGAIPNDTCLGSDGLRVMVVTGPNMGGKSSYMCQVAQLVLLAQAGCWVPAAAMTLRACDGIFTRMGAEDSILHGRSTFLHELQDVSALLEGATPASLVLLDELGRGTATYDGIAIAAATLEHIVCSTRCCCLFVTHHPEVCRVAESLPHTKCFHMAYQCSGDWSLRQRPDAASLQHTAAPGASAQIEDGRSWTSEHRGATGRSLTEVIERSDGRAQHASLEEAPDSRTSHVRGERSGSKVKRLVFLYRLSEGPAGASFGLNVAVMSGIPDSVIHRAAAVVSDLEGRRAVASSCDAAPLAAGGTTERLQLTRRVLSLDGERGSLTALVPLIVGVRRLLRLS